MAEEDCEMCQNCKRDIPINNYRMHTVHCVRNVVLCPDCSEPYPRSQLQRHQQEAHSTKECDWCSQEMAPLHIVSHKKSSCPKRPVFCSYCKLEFTARDCSDHESYCGSRTEQCPECKDFVMLKDWEEHQKMTLYHELAKRPCAQVFGYEPLKADLVPGWNATDCVRETIVPPSTKLPPYKKNSDGLARDSSRRILSTTSFGSHSVIAPTAGSPANVGSNGFLPHPMPSPKVSQSLKKDPSVNKDASIPAPPSSYGSTKDDFYSKSSAIGAAPKVGKNESIGKDEGALSGHSKASLAGRKKSNYSSIVSSVLRGSTEKKQKGPEDAATVEAAKKDELAEDSIPCEFCDQLIPMLQLIKHQTNCTRNMDSLYFNAHLPLDKAEKRVLPGIVSRALIGRGDAGGRGARGPEGAGDAGQVAADDTRGTWKHSARSEEDDNSRVTRAVKAAKENQHHQALNPKAVGNGGKEDVAAAKDQSTDQLHLPFGRTAPTKNEPPTAKLISFDGDGDSDGGRDGGRDDQVAVVSHEPVPPVPVPPSRSKAVGGARPKVSNTSMNQDQNGGIVAKYLKKKNRAPNPPLPVRLPDDLRTHVRSEDEDGDRPWRKYLLAAERATRKELMKEEKQQQQEVIDAKPQEQRRRQEQQKKTRKDQESGEAMEEREKLRTMLCNLRKDPFDEDLENNDGSFFPCEFCGDPYPSEFIMRHQLSCDLNPSPVTPGQGFDYATIRSRAEKNIELAKAADRIQL